MLCGLKSELHAQVLRSHLGEVLGRENVLLTEKRHLVSLRRAIETARRDLLSAGIGAPAVGALRRGRVGGRLGVQHLRPALDSIRGSPEQLSHALLGVQSRESSAGEVLRRLRRAAGAALRELLGRAAGGRALLRRAAGPRSRRGGGRPRRRATPGSYTPQHLAEKILTNRSALEGERKQVTVLFADVAGLHRAVDPSRPGGPARRDGRLFPPRDGGGAPLRRHGESVHGRRRHGAVRRAHRARGPRGARGGGVLGHPEGARGVRCRSTSYARASSSACVSVSTPARWWSARSATTCAWTTRRRARR